MDSATYAALMDLFTVVLIAIGIGLVVFAVLRRTNPLAHWGSLGNVYTSPLRWYDFFPAASLVFILWGMIAVQGLVTPEELDDKPMGVADVAFGGTFHLMLLGGVLSYLVAFRQINLEEFFGVRQLSAMKVVLYGLGFLIIAFAFVWVSNLLYVNFVLDGRWEEMGTQKVVTAFREGGLGLKLVIAVTAIVVAPLAEEVIFRGFLYPVLKKFTDRVFAGLVTSVLFAIVHANVPALVPLGVLAIFFCIAYEVTGSIWVPIFMHALFNAVMVVRMLF